MADSGGRKYCIYDPQKKSSIWVGLREPGYPFAVIRDNPERDEVTLLMGDGRKVALMLCKAKVSSRVATIVSAGAPASVFPAESFVGLTPEQVAARERLAAVRAESERRKFERMRSSNSGSTQSEPDP